MDSLSDLTLTNETTYTDFMDSITDVEKWGVWVNCGGIGAGVNF